MTSASKDNPIFVVGSGRSGTTLLRNLINAGQGIHIPYESDFIARAYPVFHDKTSFTEEDFQILVRFFMKTSQKAGWHMDVDYLLDCLRQGSPKNFADINAIFYDAYLAKEGLQNCRWGIKTPVLVASLDRIFAVFPTAKVVHIVRDGRDVFLSYQNIHQKARSSERFGPKTMPQNILYWVSCLRYVERYQSQHNDRIHELRYEDLLEQPEQTLRQLFSFLGIEYDPSIPERYLEAPQNQALLCLERHYQNTVDIQEKGGIDPQNAQKYLSRFTKLQRFQFELFSWPYLRKYQYPIEFSFLGSILWQPIRWVAYFGAMQYNQFRYQKRDRDLYQKVLRRIPKASSGTAPQSRNASLLRS